MSLDSVAIVGEVMSWIGLGIGLPVLIIARVLRIAGSRWQAVDITVIEQQGRPVARWFAAGAIHERPVLPREAARFGEGWHAGRVSTEDADRIRFGGPSDLGQILATTGTLLVCAGGVGFVVSLLPLFW